MDGRNSVGRRISLLNDDAPHMVPVGKASFSKFSTWSNNFQYPRDPTSNSGRRILAAPEYHRTHSSATSISDPPTPQLVRSDSTDSAVIQRTPSPLTPNLGLERLSIMSGSGGQSHYSSAQPKAAYSELELAVASAPQPYRPLFAQQINTTVAQSSYSRSHPSPPPSASASSQRPTTPQASGSLRSRRAPVKSSKNTYPCPLGHQFNCDRYFTTSGHAARHAKIHSGEKNIICPDCDKRFARKDNMDQHRKTHRRGGASSDTDSVMANDSSTSDTVLETTSCSIAEEKQKADLKADAKLRRARKRSMRSPEPLTLHGLTSSDESLNTMPTAGSESPYSGSRSERKPSFSACTPRQRSSSGSNSLDVLANIATSRLAETRPSLGRSAVYMGREPYDSGTESP
jgi:Zinc finger, C2H2 type